MVSTYIEVGQEYETMSFNDRYDLLLDHYSPLILNNFCTNPTQRAYLSTIAESPDLTFQAIDIVSSLGSIGTKDKLSEVDSRMNLFYNLDAIKLLKQNNHLKIFSCGPVLLNIYTGVPSSEQEALDGAKMRIQERKALFRNYEYSELPAYHMMFDMSILMGGMLVPELDIHAKALNYLLKETEKDCRFGTIALSSILLLPCNSKNAACALRDNIAKVIDPNDMYVDYMNLIEKNINANYISSIKGFNAIYSLLFPRSFANKVAPNLPGIIKTIESIIAEEEN